MKASDTAQDIVTDLMTGDYFDDSSSSTQDEQSMFFDRFMEFFLWITVISFVVMVLLTVLMSSFLVMVAPMFLF